MPPGPTIDSGLVGRPFSTKPRPPLCSAAIPGHCWQPARKAVLVDSPIARIWRRWGFEEANQNIPARGQHSGPKHMIGRAYIRQGRTIGILCLYGSLSFPSGPGVGSASFRVRPWVSQPPSLHGRILEPLIDPATVTNKLRRGDPDPNP
jgi:hypothetical protein